MTNLFVPVPISKQEITLRCEFYDLYNRTSLECTENKCPQCGEILKNGAQYSECDKCIDNFIE